MKNALVVGCAAALLAGAPLAAARVGGSTTGGSERAAARPQNPRQEPGGTGWAANATAYRGQNGAHFVFTCPVYGVAGPLWGTDIYTDDSSVCTAAVHAGRITLAGGGSVTIEIRPGQSSYTGSTRNGITSASYASWLGSYVIVDASPGNPGVGVGGAGWDANASAFRTFVGAQFAYTCPANGTPGQVWGTDVYTDDSRVCTAAVHAGLITIATGGNVTIEMRPGQSSYTGSTRNGITSASYGSWGGSYVIVGAPGGGGGGTPPPPPPPPPSGTPTGTVLVNGAPFTGGQIAFNSEVDVTGGSLLLTTDTGSITVTGRGIAAAFVLLPGTDNGKALVEMRLSGGNFNICKRKLAAVSKVKAKTVRQLWGKGTGRFRTRGRYAAATVRGTEWLTADRCDGTLTQVRAGRVQVQDLVKKKTVVVPAGKSYLAKKP